MGFQPGWLQDVTRPSGGGTFQRPEHGDISIGNTRKALIKHCRSGRSIPSPQVPEAQDRGPESRGRSRNSRGPLVSPGPQLTGTCTVSASKNLDLLEGFELEEEEEEKEGDGHLEAHMEGNNMPSPPVDRGKVLHEGPGKGVVEELMKGKQEDPQDPGKIHPDDL